MNDKVEKLNYPYALGCMETRLRYMWFDLEGELRKRNIDYDGEIISILKDMGQAAVDKANQEAIDFNKR